MQGLNTLITNKSTPLCCLSWWTETTSSILLILVAVGLAQMDKFLITLN